MCSVSDTFSPLAFPPGMIIYDLSISVPPTTHLEIFPFEVFREPLVIIAIADGTELYESSSDREPNGVVAGKHPRPVGIEELIHDVEALEDSYPRSLVRQLMIFDYDGVSNPHTDPEGITWVPPPGKSLTTTIKTVMCDITALVLKGLSSFTASMEDWPAIESPKASSWGPRRTTEARPVDKLQHRMTMPAQLPSRPGGSISAPDTPTGSVGHDSPTTFDEITRSIQLANRAETLKSASKPSSKEHSRERKTGQSIGALNVNDRAKARVKGRLKVVVGSLYLQAGLWPDAIKELVEGATVARAGSDYIWHAKALETIILCLLMLGWAGMDFNVGQTDSSTNTVIISEILANLFFLVNRSRRYATQPWINPHSSPVRPGLRATPPAIQGPKAAQLLYEVLPNCFQTFQLTFLTFIPELQTSPMSLYLSFCSQRQLCELHDFCRLPTFEMASLTMTDSITLSRINH